MIVVLQVFVEEKNHGELRKDKTQLKRKREKTGDDTHLFFKSAMNLRNCEEFFAKDSHGR